MMTGQQPIIVLKEGTKREKGKGAQENNIQAARAISEAVKSTLGPKGMDKMLVDSMGDVVVTNDGATILKEIDVEHPAAKIMVEIGVFETAVKKPAMPTITKAPGSVTTPGMIW